MVSGTFVSPMIGSEEGVHEPVICFSTQRYDTGLQRYYVFDVCNLIIGMKIRFASYKVSLIYTFHPKPPPISQDMMQTATSDPNSPTYSTSIHWMPHGKAFVITDPDAFSSEVLARYFKSTKFKSFTRKLYRWGFRQITKGPDKGSYHHELFVRDDPTLCVKMNCHYSDKELRTQADNAAKRRGSYGSVTTDKPVRRTSGARDALANATERLTLGTTRRGSYTVSGDDDDDDMAIMRAAAAFGGGGSRTSTGGRASLSGRVSGAGRLSAPGRRGSGTQFQQAQRRVSATRRTSYGSAVSGLGFDDDDHSMSEAGAASGGKASAVPTSINIGGASELPGVNTTVAEKSSSAVEAAVAAAQSQAAAQYSAMTGNASTGEPKTAEDIMAHHRLEDAILAQQEAAIRARREQLQKEQEDRLKALELMAATKSGASVSTHQSTASASATSVPIPGVPTDPSQIKAMQDQMCQARAAQLQQEQEERLKALELMAAQGGGGLDPATAAKMKHIQEEMSRARAAQVQKEQEDRLKALELMAAAKVVGQQATPSLPIGNGAAPAPQPQTALDILAEASATATAKSSEAVETTTPKGGTDVEQRLLLDAMKKYQQQG